MKVSETASTGAYGRALRHWQGHEAEPPPTPPRRPGRRGKLELSPTASLAAASQILGALVFDRRGDVVGRIRDLYLERTTGEVSYVLVAVSGRVGARLAPIPASLLRYARRRGGFLVPLLAADLADAPRLCGAERRSFGEPEQRRQVGRFYGPYAHVTILR